MSNEGCDVLIIEDDAPIVRLLSLELSTHGYRVETALNGEDGLDRVFTVKPQIVLLDLMLPGISGFEVLEQIKLKSGPPVIVVSAQTNENTRAAAIALGADGFISKPFTPQHVTESVELLLAKGRGVPMPSFLVQANGIEIDLQQRRVTRVGEPVHLTQSEWRLVQELAQHAGEPRLNEELLSRVWGQSYRHDVEYLRVCVQRLRAKLGDNAEQPRIIVPFLDVGFCLNGRRV